MTTSIEQLAARVRRLEQGLKRATTTPQLAYSSVEDGAIDVNNIDGDQVMVIGKQFDGTNTAATLAGPTPPQPSTPTVTPISGGLKVAWDGQFAADGVTDTMLVAPMDFARVDVVVSTAVTPDFIATVPSHGFASPRGGEVFLALDELVVHHVALATRSLAGKASAPSVATDATPLAVATGSGGVKTFHDALEPTGLDFDDEGAIWYNDTGAVSRWDGLDWISVADERIAQAVTDAGNAQTVAGGKNTVFRQTATPTALAANDVWFKTDTDNEIYQATGPGTGIEDAAAGTTGVWGKMALGPQALTDDILVVNNVYGRDGYFGTIAAEKIVGDQLRARLAVIGGLNVGTGISITPENGIVIQTPAGQTKFPSNGTANILSGDVTASSLTVLGQLAIRGVTNEISKNAKVTLQTGTTPPMAGPSVTATYPTHAIHEGWTPNGFVHYPTTDQYFTAESLFGAGIVPTFQDANGDYIFSFESWSLNDAGGRPEVGHAFGGMTIIGDNAYLLCGVTDEVVPGTYDGLYYIYKVHKETSGWSYVSRAKYEPPGVETQLGAASPHKPVIGNDGTNLIVAQAGRASGNLNFTRYASTNLAYVSRTASNLNMTADANALCVTSADVGGGPYYWVVAEGRTVYCITTAGVRQTAHEFQTAAANTKGLLWDGSKFRSRTAATAHDYSAIIDSDLASSAVNVVTTWRKADGVSPDFAQYETGISPRTSTTAIPKRATLTVSTAPIPDDAGDPNDANSISVYIARGPSPVLADYKRVTPPAVGVTSVSLNALPTATGAPVAVPFPDSTPASIVSAATDGNGPVISLNGSGAGRVGPLLWTPSVGTGPRAASISAAAAAQSIANATWTMANMEEAAPDYNFGFGAIVNNSLTIPETGLYAITAGANFASTGTGRRIYQVEAYTTEAVGAGIILAREERPGVAGVYAGATMSTEAYLTAGTNLRLAVYQTSGSAQDLKHDFVPAKLTARLVRI